MASSDFIKQGVPVQVDNSFLQGPEAKLEKCALSGDTISLFNSQRAILVSACNAGSYRLNSIVCAMAMMMIE